jgi:hypothetical protein
VQTSAREPEQAMADSARLKQVSVQPGNGASSLEKVRQRLEQSGINETEFLDVLKAAQIQKAENGDLLAIHEKTLRLALDSWDTVTALCDELRERKAEGK